MNNTVEFRIDECKGIKEKIENIQSALYRNELWTINFNIDTNGC